MVMTTQHTEEKKPAKVPAKAKAAQADQKKIATVRKHPTRPKVATAEGIPELLGIKDPKKPVTFQDVWDFVKKHAGDHTHNVEIVPLDNVSFDAERPLPFTQMERQGRRASIAWMLVNGCGDEHDRRLSTFLKEALSKGASQKRCQDLVAALNGGYSESSKSWGTPFIKLRIVKTAVKEEPKKQKEAAPEAHK